MNHDTTRVWKPSRGLKNLRGLARPEDLTEALGSWREAQVAEEGGPRYRVAGILGRGSQGIVFEVEDRDTRRRVAFKTLHQTHRADDDVSRFIHEAQITAQLEHPGIVPVHDLETLPDGTVFYIMKRIEGRSLAEVLEAITAGQPDQPSRADLLQAFQRVCDTMAFAHDRGVVHRDIKPRNLMLGAYGEVLVLDWGLAKVLGLGPDRHETTAVGSVRTAPDSDADIHQTLVGCAVGTPAYMSPEQARGEPADARSDIYALGVTLYTILAGCSPYQRGALRATLDQAASGTWTPLGGRPAARGLPRRLIAIVHKAMALVPEKRYQRAGDLAADVRRYLADEAVEAYQERLHERALRAAVRHRRTVWAAGCTVGLGVTIIAAALVYRHHVALNRAEDLRMQAAARESEHHWNEAMALHERILEIIPDDRTARSASQRAAIRAEQEQVAHAARLRAEEGATWKARARAAETSNSEADYEQAAGFFLRALGLVPDDGEAATGYRRAVAAYTAFATTRRANENTQRAEAERTAAAAALLRRADDAASTGATAAAVSFVESAMAIQSSPESGRRLGELVALQRDEEARHRTAARHIEAEAALAAMAEAITQGNGQSAAAHLERARGFSADHPGLIAAAAAVETQRRKEFESAAEAHLILAASTTTNAELLARKLTELDVQVTFQRGELEEQGGAEVRLRLHQSESALADCAREHAAVLATTIAMLDRAGTAAPWHPPVRKALAAHWIARLLDAENGNDPAEAAVAEAQAKAWDDGHHAELLTNVATVQVPATAAGVTLRVLRVNSERVLGPSGEPIAIVPGGHAQVPCGRYLVSQGEVTSAVRLSRGLSLILQLSQPPANLPLSAAWIPGGALRDRLHTVVVPGFGLARQEVTVGEWLEFLNDPIMNRRFATAEREGELILVPRLSATAEGPLWQRNRSGFAAERATGETIPLLAPVTGISYQDAVDFAEWRAQRDGVAWRLPTAEEWRFAVQGGDGRPYPWGDLPDPGHCASLLTCPHDQAQAVLVGSFPLDCSVQGVFDLAGSVSEWTASGAGRLRLALGGNRLDRAGERFSDQARRDVDPRLVHMVIGLRLAVTP